MTRLGRFTTPSAAALALLLALTLAVRVGVLVAMWDNLSQDPDAYRNIAENFQLRGVFGFGSGPRHLSSPRPTAYRPPLYPLVLAKCAAPGFDVTPLRVAILHVGLGLATVWLTWIVARQLSEPRNLSSRPTVVGDLLRAADGASAEENRSERNTVFPFAAGLLVALDPILLRQSTLVMTETLAAFLTVLCLDCLNRFDRQRAPWTAGLVGAAIALAILCRPTYLPWLALVAFASVFLRSRFTQWQLSTLSRGQVVVGDWCWRGLNVASMILIAGALVSPWVIRNYQEFGKPIVTTTHGGYTFYLANNPYFYRYLRSADRSVPWPASELDFDVREGTVGVINNRRIVDQVDFDRYCYEQAWLAIKANPTDFFYSCLYRLRQLWSPLPHQLTADESFASTAMRYAVAAWYVAVYLLAAIGIWKLRSKLLAPPWLWGVLLCMVFTGIHTFYWTNLRMRAPLMPFVALVAAYGLTAIWVAWRRRTGFQPVQAG
ncbi:MAG TPA: hypothetical protein VFB96_08965 [Pirellulaceae bacterium]|nr:hypothetical protein [Pirellulaceae bacterium]